MNKKTYTLAELVERSVPYFASNSDVPHLLAVTTTGKLYRPEFESYAQHGASKNGGEVLVIDRELTLKPVGMSYEDALAEAGLVIVPIKSADHPFVNGITMPADKVLPATLAELVASATHVYFPPADFVATEPAPTDPAKTIHLHIDTSRVQAIVDAGVKRVTEAAASTAEAPTKRAYKPRAPKPAAEVATESAPAAPSVRKPRAPKPAAQATATKKKAPTKTTN